ncbi:MAG: hypothetical protein WCO23_04305 [bacterium]
MPPKKVSEKSTKQDLWEAYNGLLGEMSQESIVFPATKNENIVPESLKKFSDLKITFGQPLDKLGSDLLSEIEGMASFKKTIEKQKQEIIEAMESRKNLLESEIKRARDMWEQEKGKFEEENALIRESQKITREREEEEYAYNLKIKRRNEIDEYNKIKVTKEAMLISKEEALKQREKDADALQKEIELLPSKIDEAVKRAQEMLGKELKDKHAQELRELNMTHSSEIKILELKNINLDSNVAVQKNEIESLKKQILDLNKQLKEMAVSVIESQGNSNKNAQSSIG